MRKNKLKNNSLYELVVNTGIIAQNFIQEDRKELLSYIDKHGLEGLKERLEKELKQ